MTAMNPVKRHFFSLHDLLTMAALAALGGVTSSAVSMIRAAIHAIVVIPGGMQFLAGVHVLWLVIAVGLVRRPGAATITGLLKGSVEVLSGNPLGLLVLLYSGLAGIIIDAIWLVLGGRHRPIVYVLAGGAGAASNVLVFKLIGSLPAQGIMAAGLAIMAGMAFVSGVLLGGLLGWWLLESLRLAGVVGARRAQRPVRMASASWAHLGASVATFLLIAGAIYVAAFRAGAEPTADAATSRTSQNDTTMPQ